MSDQSKALQLADILGRLIQRLRRTPMPLADVIPYLIEAADELRRLHDENDTLRIANEVFGRRQEWWNNRMVELENKNKAQDALLRQALEAILAVMVFNPSADEYAKGRLAITAILAALTEQPAEQPLTDDPVAMRYGFDGYGYHYIDSGSGSDWRTRIDDAEPLYTHPQPTKQPLSQYAIDRIVGSLQVQWPDYFDLEAATKFARAIEAEHGITGEQK